MATSDVSPLSSGTAKPIQCGPYTKAQFQNTIEGARNVKSVEEIEELLRDYPAALELYRTGKYKVKVKCEVDVERVILVEKRVVKNKSEPSTNNQIVPNVNEEKKKDVENTNPVSNDDHQVAKVPKENLIHTASSSIRLTSNTQPKVEHHRASSKERPKENYFPLSNPSNFNWKRPQVVPQPFFPFNFQAKSTNGSFHGYFPPNPTFRTFQTPISFQHVPQQWPSATPVHLHPALYSKRTNNAHQRARSVDPACRRPVAPQMLAQPMFCRPAPPPAAPAPAPPQTQAPAFKPATNPEKLSIRQLNDVFLQTSPTGRLQLHVIPEVLQRFAIQTTSDSLIAAAQDLQYNPNEPISARRLIHILVKLGKIAKSARPAETPAN